MISSRLSDFELFIIFSLGIKCAPSRDATFSPGRLVRTGRGLGKNLAPTKTVRIDCSQPLDKRCPSRDATFLPGTKKIDSAV